MIHSAGTRRISLLLILTIVGGCGKSGPQRATVAGAVQMDGQPVESGSIAFYPVEGTRGPSAGGPIEAGRYRIDSAKGVVVGKARVEINFPKKTGRMIPDPINSKALVEEYVEGVPSKYNSESTLVRDIAVGENQLDFDLTSK